MADDTNTAERDAFEAHCLRTGLSEMGLRKWGETDDVPPRMRGDYIMRIVQNAWLAFQAGRASLAASAGSEPVARVNDDGFIVEIGDLLIAPGQKLYTHPSPPEGMAGWKPIATAPKDGTLILVHFKSKGVRAVSWDSPFHDEVTEENGIWCVDDDKHGPYGLRGYNDDGPTAPTHWMPLPAPPLPASEAKEL